MNAAETNSELVRRFCDAFARLDADELIGYFTEDALYHNIPLAPLRGHSAIHAFFRDIPNQFDALGFETLHQVASGDLVMNERVDHFLKDGRRVALPVAGIFRIEQGKIAEWRDYFNLATLEDGFK